MLETQPRTGGPATITFSLERSADVRFALWLTYITLGWMTIEGAASLLLGWASKSLLLEAFGIDSVVELFSARVLLWRLKVEAGGLADETGVEAVERRRSELPLAAVTTMATTITGTINRPDSLIIELLRKSDRKYD